MTQIAMFFLMNPVTVVSRGNSKVSARLLGDGVQDCKP